MNIGRGRLPWRIACRGFGAEEGAGTAVALRHAECRNMKCLVGQVSCHISTSKMVSGAVELGNVIG